MKNRLQEIHDSIGNMLIYSDDLAKQYILLLNESIQIIENIDSQPDSILESWKNIALNEIANELTNRVNPAFFKADIERKKNEFKFSKAVVSLSLTNILMNY
jgi:hypothetical protein